LALAGIAAADVHTNKQAKLSFDAPKSYKLTEEDAQMKGESEDKAVALAFWLVDSGDADKATQAVAQQFYTALASLTWEKPKTGKVNGLAATFIDGTGRTTGKTLDLQMAVVGPTATKKYAILIGIVDHAKADAHKAEIAAILKSVKPAK
ncbi:MAG: hypothetical protein JO257_21200, partial [Deltaproteobacteria bacterium]|nr:hypothetical protein [Deltaproteobacteria bacterium]